MSDPWILALIGALGATATAFAWAKAHHWRCELGRHRGR